jgi:DNA polymerase III epsilon subunit-like protein
MIDRNDTISNENQRSEKDMNFIAIDFETAKYSRESGIHPFIGDLPLAAHNATFDMGVLRAALEWYDCPYRRLSIFVPCAGGRPGLWNYRTQGGGNIRL